MLSSEDERPEKGIYKARRFMVWPLAGSSSMFVLQALRRTFEGFEEIGPRVQLKELVVVGRSLDSNIVLIGLLASRRHAELRLQLEDGEEQLYVFDQSFNGTTVNDERIRPGTPFRLRHGDILGFCPVSTYRVLTA